MRMLMPDAIDAMMERTLKSTNRCRKCGESFSFEQGAAAAREIGIREQVAACPHCYAVFTVDVGPQAVQLLTDVTEQHRHLIDSRPRPETQKDGQSAARPEPSMDKRAALKVLLLVASFFALLAVLRYLIA